MDKHDDFDDLLGELGLGDEPKGRRKNENVNTEKPIINNKLTTNLDDGFDFASYVPSTKRRSSQRREISFDFDKDVKPKVDLNGEEKSKGRWNIDKSSRRNSLSFELLDTTEEESEKRLSTSNVDDKLSWLSKPVNKLEQVTNPELQPDTKSTSVVTKEKELDVCSNEVIKELMETEMKKLVQIFQDTLDRVKNDVIEKISNDYLQLRNEGNKVNAELIKLKEYCEEMMAFHRKLEPKLDELKQHRSPSIENVTREECGKLRNLIEFGQKSNQQNAQFKDELIRRTEKLENKQKEYRNDILQHMERSNERFKPEKHQFSSHEERLELKEERKRLSIKTNDLHNAWEAAYKQLLVDQSNFLAAQTQSITSRNNNASNVTINSNFCEKWRKEDEEKLEKRRLKLEENENCLTQLAHQLKARSTQLENICQSTIQMRNESLAATLQLAKRVNSSSSDNLQLNKQSSVVNNSITPVKRNEYAENAVRDRQFLKFEKLYLSVCRI